MGSLVSIDREMTIYMDGRRDEAKDLHSELHGKLVMIDEGLAIRDAIVAEHNAMKARLRKSERRVKDLDRAACLLLILCAVLALSTVYLFDCINHPEAVPYWLRPATSCEVVAQ